ncbi:MAG: phage head closure protein [Rhodobacteraceae bacterium]|nr:phage head closure protein [Paracoccaceae bacterium]
MSVPNLNRKLVLEEAIRTPDSMGGVTEVWTPVGEIWASIDARGGAERLIAGRTVPITKFKIVTRAAPFGSPSRPRAEQRFVEGGRVFDILAVAEMDGAAQYLEIWAEEGRS